MSGNNNKKRKYQGNNNRGWKHRNPRRGGPGVLLTCETGRENKCRREGIAILQHYFPLGLSGGIDSHHVDTNDSTQDDTKSSLTLEEELKMLRSQKPSASMKFSPYETGSKGSVFLMCTAEGCRMIPPIHVDRDEDKDDDDNDDNGKETSISNVGKGSSDENVTKVHSAKKQRIGDKSKKADGVSTDRSDDATDSTPKEEDKKTGTNPWDPVPVVRKIFDDVEQNITSAPGSRFVTRMIPIQATCFASAAEIKATSEALLEKFFFPFSYKSFAVSVQKRLCNNVKKPEIIDIIAGRILDSDPKYKVSLENPDVTIVVEIARTLCGIAIAPNSKEMPKFSLVIAREKATPTEE